MHYAPGDATKWRSLAIALLQADPTSAHAALAKAVELHPFETDARLGLAVEGERRGDLAQAERYYLEAAKRSRRFKPQSALAGFYFRTGRLPEFWDLAAKAASIPLADITPLFHLAHETGVAPERVRKLLRLESPHAQSAYLKFALENKLVDQAAATAVGIPIRDEDKLLLLNACDYLIQTDRIAAAVALWNRLSKAGLSGFDGLDPEHGRSLTNGRFALVPVRGFNWKFTDLPGIVARSTSASSTAIEFSGEQPQEGLVLYQLAPILPGRTYHLRLRYETADLSGPTGLTLTAQPVLNGKAEAIAVTAISASEDGTATAEFKAPENCDLFRLGLYYKRAPGTVRINGVLTLLSADLELRS